MPALDALEYVAAPRKDEAGATEGKVVRVEVLKKAVFDRYGIDAETVVYLGSDECALGSMRKEGVLAVQYAEGESVGLDGDELKINSLFKLRHILESDDENE